MEISFMRHESGPASGKTAVIVDNYGSFQVVVTALYGCGVSTMYIANNNEGKTVLCGTLQEVAIHLGCDYDEFIEDLYHYPDWDKR